MIASFALALVVAGGLGDGASVGASVGGQSTRLAVLPFKNLNTEPALDWLKLGVAETMISDLKSARRDVVERDQIDRALAEIALQGAKLTDESRAAAAGKIVGATHVVVGGFQRADKQVRITARMVVVETGVVDSTAKVTGDLEDIFGLQDALVGQLLKLPDPKRRPKPKKPKATIEAYQAYAQSLSTSSDAEKIEQLRRALDLDPDFHYALFDLRALESRLNRYARQGREIVDERVRAQLKVVFDEKVDIDERNMQASQVMGALIQQFRYATLLEVATQIESSRIPPGKYVHAREYASYYIFLSLQMLKRTDLALQHGERYLQTWPAGTFAQSLQMTMRSMIEQGHRHEEAVKRAGRDMEKMLLDERKYEDEQTQRKKPIEPWRVRNFDWQRCSINVQGERWVEGLETCQQFIKQYGQSEDGDDLVKLGHYMIARCYSELGRFDEANDIMLRLLDAHPVWAREHSMETIRGTFPKP